MAHAAEGDAETVDVDVAIDQLETLTNLYFFNIVIPECQCDHCRSVSNNAVGNLMSATSTLRRNPPRFFLLKCLEPHIDRAGLHSQIGNQCPIDHLLFLRPAILLQIDARIQRCVRLSTKELHTSGVL